MTGIDGTPRVWQQELEAGDGRFWPGELPANDQGQQTAQDHHEQPEEQELTPDHLVIGGEDVGPPEAELVMLGVRGGRVGSDARSTHGLALPSIVAAAATVCELDAGPAAFKFSAAHFA